MAQLHADGIDGRGIGIAVIDQPLLLGHEEYSGRIVRYDATGLGHMGPQMHASPVASIAVGETIGVAPAAELSFFAVPMWRRDNRPYAAALDRIVDLNGTLPEEQRIRVVTISDGAFRRHDGPELWQEALRRAEASGVLVISCDTSVLDYGMLQWIPGTDPDQPSSYRRGRYSKATNALLVPGGNRTLASHRGNQVYWFDPTAGMSWGAPYLGGLAALALQVDPELEPARVRALLTETATRTAAGPVVCPACLIEAAKAPAGKAGEAEPSPS